MMGVHCFRWSTLTWKAARSRTRGSKIARPVLPSRQSTGGTTGLIHHVTSGMERLIRLHQYSLAHISKAWSRIGQQLYRKRRSAQPAVLIWQESSIDNPDEAEVYALPRSTSRTPASFQEGGGERTGKGLHFHMVVSTAFLLLALAGWGAFGWSVLTDKARQGELQREVVRLTAEREREVALARRARSDVMKVEEELAIARKGITSLIEALEQSRSALALARQETQILRRQAQPAPASPSGQPPVPR